jgi:ribonuclease Z
VISNVQFSLTILGSSSALPTSKRFPIAHLLNVNERFFLIDCGEGTQMQLRKFRSSFGKINHIFISHTHGDHVFGLPGLLSTFQLLGRKTDLHIYAPGELGILLDFYRKNFGEDLTYRIILHSLGYKRPHVIFSDKQVEVMSFPLKHRVPACGFLFREKPALLNLRKESMDIYKPGIEEIKEIKAGSDLTLHSGTVIPNSELTLPPWLTRSYAYCSDTAYYPEIAAICKDVDLLYHEATFSSEDQQLAEQTMHSTSADAARIAILANAKKLLIGHFSSRYKSIDPLLIQAKTLFPDTIAVNDGDNFTIERQRAVSH